MQCGSVQNRYAHALVYIAIFKPSRIDFGSVSEINSTMPRTGQTSPASVAGVTRSVWCAQQKRYRRRKRRRRSQDQREAKGWHPPPCRSCATWRGWSSLHQRRYRLRPFFSAQAIQDACIMLERSCFYNAKKLQQDRDFHRLLLDHSPEL